MERNRRADQNVEAKQNANAQDDYFTKAPTISLPKGGGAIKGIGEKFAANPVTGTGSMSVPIAVSPGRGGFGPQLALSYDSGAGNGAFGLGWSLALPAIARKTDKGLPKYRDDEPDIFILSGAEDLVPAYRKNADDSWTKDHDSIDGYHVSRYRPRVEGLFARIEKWTNPIAPSDCFWRTISKENITTWYGKTPESRIYDPENPDRIFSWLICETYDDKGNASLYQYKAENSDGISIALPHERNRTHLSRSANRYLKRVKYGNSVSRLLQSDLQAMHWYFEVVFDYGEHNLAHPTPDEDSIWNVRVDPFSTYRSGFEVRSYRLCQRVLMFHHIPDSPDGPGYEGLVRSTDFFYKASSKTQQGPLFTNLAQVFQKSYQLNGNGDYRQKSLPPIDFSYSEAIIDNTVRTIDSKSLENLPEGLDGSRYQWVDLDGEGLSGMLTEQGGEWFYKRNLSPLNSDSTRESDSKSAKFAPLELIQFKPNRALANGAQLLDLAGDGQLDLVTFDDPNPGFFERGDNADWTDFKPFESLPNLDWRNPQLKFIDLTGDGHTDILITEDDAFIWHTSLAEAGFGRAQRIQQQLDEEQGPRLVFADAHQSIHLADMSGDGLTDLVRIRNGEVCYWPNLGYGRFGAKVTMSNSPYFDTADIFDQRRIRLADIDGTGTIDILYLAHAGAKLYFNRSGNGWSDPELLTTFPLVDDLSSVMTVDLLGNGTACLVWSSPLPDQTQTAMRYIDLMGGNRFDSASLEHQHGQKPYLLIKTRNNLGAETEIHYLPSTYFYLQDKYAGKPWITKLPFPVHCVASVTVTDRWRNSRFTSTYSYHHGYFDGYEREFRGFGRVEQTDVEDFGVFNRGNRHSPYIADDLTLYQPPVKTISWFHTGVYRERGQILSHYRHEYFTHPGYAEHQLPEPDLTEQNLTADEWRQALRACKGMLLRQEVYELNVDALARGEEKPVKLFSTAFHNNQIQRLQPQGDNPHAVFLVTESEAITYHYELDLTTAQQPDPRIAHTLNLAIDEYGNVLESASVVYPRLHPFIDETLALTSADVNRIRDVQAERHLVYTQTRYTELVGEGSDFIHQHRLPLPCEVKTYEVKGLEPNDFYFTFNELRDANIARSVTEIPYHQFHSSGLIEKRCVEHVRTLYFHTDLQTPLEFGRHNALALPFENYKLALTRELLDRVFGNERLSEALTDLNNANTSGYLTGHELTNRFADMEEGHYWIRSGIAGFAEDAANHFYLPERYTDPFGATTRLEYDSRDLYIQQSADPVGNVTRVKQFDCRVLAPSILEDINGNLSEVYFDTLGLPAAVALRGKGDEADGLTAMTDDLINPGSAQLQGFFQGDRYDEVQARAWLGDSTSRFVYHFGEVEHEDGSIQWGLSPSCACAIQRERHSDEDTPLQTAFEYSDGLGQVLVKKLQAEPEKGSDELRWLASGKTVLNNKGKPVKQYEPYFSDTGHRFDAAEAAREVGVTPILYYDAPGRVIRAEMPDGTVSRVVFTPWFMQTWDASDTVLEADNPWYARMTGPTSTPEQRRAAAIAEKHKNTPATTHLDSLGREVVSVAHNRTPVESDEFRSTPLLDRHWAEEFQVTFTKLDIEGKPLWIRDARGNLVMQYLTPAKPTMWSAEPNENVPVASVPCYDIAGNLLFQHSMDGGERRMLMDAAGQPFYAWDVNGVEGSEAEYRLYRTQYDRLRRPLQQQLSLDGGNLWQTVERFVYGDLPELFASPEDAKVRNLRGQIYCHSDPSGLLTNQRFDFKSNLLEVTRRMASAYESRIIHWPENPPDSAFVGETFTQRTEYDALNRMNRLYNWHQANGSRVAVYEPRYNRRGLLQAEELVVGATKTATGYTEQRPAPEHEKGKRTQRTSAIQHIEYNEKGQRILVRFGNNTTTRYQYDPNTFRLIKLRTTRRNYDPTFPEHHSGLTDENVLQQLTYTYDPSGNITEIHDEAYQPVFFRNQSVEPRSRYSYDALYRLIEATGREQYGASGAPPQRLPQVPRVNFPIGASNDPNALRNYTQRYIYDGVGNIMQMQHSANGGGWTQHYRYAADSNRLLKTWHGADESNTVHYQYDIHGSMLNLANVPDDYRLDWDFRDMIHHANLGGGGVAWYNYDAGKQRTRKRVQHNGSTVEERFYLGGMEWYRRWVGGELREEIETHHLFVDDQRVLLVENVLRTDDAALGERTLYRYQYGNHLGSVGLELDGGGSIISYEEYHPYGTTAYQARNAAVSATAKRYRYTGMERDEETGLSYHTARYYLPWLGRWGSVDPIGIKSGLNSYTYSSNNSIRFLDDSGLQQRVTRRQEWESWPEEYRSIAEEMFPGRMTLPGDVGAEAVIERYQKLFISHAPGLSSETTRDESAREEISEESVQHEDESAREETPEESVQHESPSASEHPSIHAIIRERVRRHEPIPIAQRPLFREWNSYELSRLPGDRASVSVHGYATITDEQGQEHSLETDDITLDEGEYTINITVLVIVAESFQGTQNTYFQRAFISYTVIVDEEGEVTISTSVEQIGDHGPNYVGLSSLRAESEAVSITPRLSISQPYFEAAGGISITIGGTWNMGVAAPERVDDIGNFRVDIHGRSTP